MIATYCTVCGLDAVGVAFSCWYLHRPIPITIDEVVDLAETMRRLNVEIPEDASDYVVPADLGPILRQGVELGMLPMAALFANGMLA